LMILAVLAVIWTLPSWVMVMTSFKTQAQMLTTAYVAPAPSPSLENYAHAYEAIGRGLFNSLVVSLPAMFLSLLVGSWSAFALSMLRYRYSLQLFFMIALATFLPYEVVLIPITQLIKEIGIINTYPGLILAYMIFSVPLVTLVMAVFFQAFPKELHEAAMIDGSRIDQFFWRVLLPMSMPGLVSAGILVFTNVWNEFLVALTLTQGPSVRPVIPALVNLRGSYVAMWHLQMAGAVLVSIPPLVLFILLGRFFVKGLVAGAFKG